MNGSTPATSLGSNEQPMTYHIIRANWQNHESALRAVREAVFITEQHVPEELEWDEFDADSIHFLAQDEQENAVGCIQNAPSSSRLDAGQPPHFTARFVTRPRATMSSAPPPAVQKNKGL